MKRVIVVALTCLLASASYAGQYQKVSSIQDLFSQWTKGTQLYVQGNVGLDEGALSQIADDLKAHPTWTTILWGDASGETYTDGNGRRRTGYDALDFGVGQGLRNVGTFASQTDEETNLASGAVLVISFNPRQVAYYSSPLEDRYGLAHKQVWQGNYDQYAIRSLKSRNIRRAISAPLEALDGALNSARQSEKTMIAQQASTAEASVAGAEKALAAAKQRAEQFAKKWPDAQGDLRRANFVGQESIIAQAKDALSQKRWPDAQSLSRQVQSSAEKLIHAYDEHQNAEQTLASLDAKAAEVAKSSYTDAAALEKAKAKVSEAKAAWQHADSNYLAFLGESQEMVEKVERSMQVAQTTAEFRRIVTAGIEVVVLIVVLLLLTILRIRRNKASAAVIFELGKWEGGLAEKAAALLKLDERRRQLLGASREDVAFSGVTKKTAEEVIDNIGYLFILHSCAMEVLRQVKERMGSGGLRYQFSTTPFVAAAEMMRNAPVRFSPESGIDIVLNGKKAKPEEVLWAPLKSFKGFELSMDELQQQFATRAKSATQKLEELQTAVGSSKSLAEAARQRISALNYAAGQAEEVPENKKLRIPPAVQSALQPALEKALATANEQRLLDPLACYRALAELDTWIGRCESVIADIQKGVTDGLPKLQSALETLEHSGVPVKRFTMAQADLLGEANTVATALAESKDAGAGYSFSAQVEKLRADAERAAELEVQRQSLVAAVETTSENISTARGELATIVDLQADKMLREEGANPDERVAKAKELLGAASTQIGHLKLDVAKALLDEADGERAKAENIVESSLSAAKAYAATRKAAEDEGALLATKQVQERAVLDEITETYADEVLLLGAGDAEHPNANGTVEDNLDEVAETTTKRDADLAKASEQYSDGKVLAAMQTLELVKAHHVFILARLSEVTDKRTRLSDTEAKNAAALETLESAISTLEANSDNSVASAETQDLAKDARKALKAASATGKKKPNPFAIADKLAEARKALEAGNQALERDGRLARQVEKVLADVGNLLKEAKRAYQASTSDDVPDSAALIAAGKKIPGLEKRVSSFGMLKHPDWVTVDQDVAALATDARAILAEIRRDQEEAGKAQKQLQSAASAISQAKRWSGSYGITISSNTGGSVIREAEAAFAAGDYARAVERASRAASLAQNAISDAESRVADARREEERQRAAARRRREEEEERRRSYESSYSSSSSTSSFSSSSWSSSDSGGSSSSFSSGDSGGSSSSW